MPSLSCCSSQVGRGKHGKRAQCPRLLGSSTALLFRPQTTQGKATFVLPTQDALRSPVLFPFSQDSAEKKM